MSSIDDVLAAATPTVAAARISVRGDLLSRHAQLEQDLARALREDETENRHAQAPGIARQIEELEAEIAAASVDFEFTSIGRDAWSVLMSKHSPSDEQRQLGYQFDPISFPIAAVAASCTSHPMSVDDAQKLSAKLSDGQWTKLWEACLWANVEGRDPFSVTAFALLHGFEKKSAQPGSTRSLEASS